MSAAWHLSVRCMRSGTLGEGTLLGPATLLDAAASAVGVGGGVVHLLGAASEAGGRGVEAAAAPAATGTVAAAATGGVAGAATGGTAEAAAEAATDATTDAATEAAATSAVGDGRGRKSVRRLLSSASPALSELPLWTF